MTGHRVGRLVVLLSFLALVAGCIGADEVDVGTEGDEAISAASQEEAGWNLSEGATHEILVGVGIPYTLMYIDPGEHACGVGRVEVHIPDGAKHLTFEIEKPVVDASEPGAGYVTLLYRHENHDDWRDASSEPQTDPALLTEPPRENHLVNITEPEEGSWFVWIYPHGPVINQAVDIAFHAQGDGPPFGEIGGSGLYGVKC